MDAYASIIQGTPDLSQHGALRLGETSLVPIKQSVVGSASLKADGTAMMRLLNPGRPHE